MIQVPAAAREATHGPGIAVHALAPRSLLTFDPDRLSDCNAAAQRPRQRFAGNGLRLLDKPPCRPVRYPVPPPHATPNEPPAREAAPAIVPPAADWQKGGSDECMSVRSALRAAYRRA